MGGGILEHNLDMGSETEYEVKGNLPDPSRTHWFDIYQGYMIIENSHLARWFTQLQHGDFP